MTRRYFDQEEYASEFSHWLRGLQPPYDSKSFVATDLDYVIHNYRECWLITIEEKRYGAEMHYAQKNTITIISQMLASSNGIVTFENGDSKHYQYRGHYTLIFQITNPEDSDWMEVYMPNSQKHLFEGQQIKRALASLLRYGNLDHIHDLTLIMPRSSYNNL